MHVSPGFVASRFYPKALPKRRGLFFQGFRQIVGARWSLRVETQSPHRQDGTLLPCGTGDECGAYPEKKDARRPTRKQRPDTPSDDVQTRSRQVSWLAGRCFIRPSQRRCVSDLKDETRRLQLRGQLRFQHKTCPDSLLAPHLEMRRAVNTIFSRRRFRSRQQELSDGLHPNNEHRFAP